MENQNNQNNPNNQKKQIDKDKTVIFNSGSKLNEIEKNEQTKVDIYEEKDSIKYSNNKERIENSPSFNEGIDGKEKIETTDNQKKSIKKDKNSISIEVVTAAVAGGGLGVGVGAVYSEDIKNVFTPATSDTSEGQEEDIQEVTNIESDSIQISENNVNYHFSDQNGVYEVNMVDLDSDGDVDTLSMHATLVDGSSLGYTVAGDNLNTHFLGNQTTFAQPVDYVSYLCNNDIPDFDPAALGAQSYHIQQGDTLSEIALANNTSIGNLLALNPQITDANMIYAGDNILIPGTGTDNNFNAGWTPNEIEDFPLEVPIESLVPDDSPIVHANYNEMDWQSFEDQPIDEYSISLNGTDFASMETPESYLDYSNDIDSLDFI